MSFFISLFSLNQEVAFCQESMELQPEKSPFCFRFWNPQSWWEVMSRGGGGGTDSERMYVPMSNIICSNDLKNLLPPHPLQFVVKNLS